jgi:hypothetical protein
MFYWLVGPLPEEKSSGSGFYLGNAPEVEEDQYKGEEVIEDVGFMDCTWGVGISCNRRWHIQLQKGQWFFLLDHNRGCR